MNTEIRLMVIAGEISSDRHGAKLITELKKSENVKVIAVGGAKMAEVSDRLEENIVGKATIGFAEVVKLIPFFAGLKKRLVRKYFKSGSEDRVDAVILIDFPGFNMRIAKIAASSGIPVFYYITPQVWAWGKKRIDILSNICRKLYCLFEFEKDIFSQAGANVEFVGHPILEDIPAMIDMEAFNSELGISEEEKVIALLPGSRENEVKRHLPVMTAAVKDAGYRIILGKSPTIDKELINSIYPGVDMTEDIYGLLKRADVAIVSSGTTTLESAVLGTPFITVYKVSNISYAIARMLVNIEYISMVNILAGREVVPELIQGDLTAGNIKEKLEKILGSDDERQWMISELERVSRMIGEPGASGRTARSILDELGS
ncbi:MAG: lipid-A-disaccharide synthase [Elusimicrobiota bacterium]